MNLIEDLIIHSVVAIFNNDKESFLEVFAPHTRELFEATEFYWWETVHQEIQGMPCKEALKEATNCASEFMLINNKLEYVLVNNTPYGSDEWFELVEQAKEALDV